MKLYAIPVETACDASCEFCITKFRRGFGDFLDPDAVEKSLEGKEFEKIEITGGGLGLKSDYWEVSDCNGNRWDFGTLADIRFWIENSEARKNWPLSGQPCVFFI